MNIDDSVFAINYMKMEEQYGKLQCRIRICEQGGRDKIHSELQKAREEYKENTLLLEEKAKNLPFSGCDQTDTGAAGLQKEDRRVHEGNRLSGICTLGQQFPGR